MNITTNIIILSLVFWLKASTAAAGSLLTNLIDTPDLFSTILLECTPLTLLRLYQTNKQIYEATNQAQPYLMHFITRQLVKEKNTWISYHVALNAQMEQRTITYVELVALHHRINRHLTDSNLERYKHTNCTFKNIPYNIQVLERHIQKTNLKALWHYHIYPQLVRNNVFNIPHRNACAKTIILWLFDNSLDVVMQLKRHPELINTVIDYGNVPLINELLKHIKHINKLHSPSGKPIIAAACSGQREIIPLLLLKKASVNTSDNNGTTPLMLAAKYHHTEVVQDLLDYNADINLQDYDGNTPLMHAAHQGHRVIIKTLRNRGADIRIRNHDGLTALAIAAQNDHLNAVKELLHTSSAFMRYKALDIAIHNNCHNVIKFLAHAAYPNIGMYYQTAKNGLIHAAQRGHYVIAEILLNYRAHVNCNDNHHNTPLHYASQHGHSTIAQLLIEHNADIHARNNEKLTPIIIATRYKKYDVVNLLIEQKACLDDTNEYGLNPLEMALKASNEFLVATFLRHEVTIKSEPHSSPLFFVIRNACINRKNIIQCLIALGESINRTNHYGQTPLITAINYNRHDIVRLLIEQGADVNIRDNHHKTAIMYAIENGHQPTVYRLRLRGATITTWYKTLLFVKKLFKCMIG